MAFTVHDEGRQKSTEDAGAPNAKPPPALAAASAPVPATVAPSDHQRRTGCGEVLGSTATGAVLPPAVLRRVFFKQLSVIGSTMGTRQELRRLMALCVSSGLRPLIEREAPMAQAPQALAEVARGEVFGKIVLTLP